MSLCRWPSKHNIISQGAPSLVVTFGGSITFHRPVEDSLTVGFSPSVTFGGLVQF